MLLSIIILNYKTKNLVRECIKGILGLSLSFEHEIIVVDNWSRDGVGTMLQNKFSSVKFIQSDRNVGMGAGNNLGLKQAQGKYVLILNPDVVVFQNSIETLIKFLGNNPEVGLVAPKILNPDKSFQSTVHRFPKFWMPFYRRTLLGKTKQGQKYLAKYTMDDKQLNKAQKIDWAFGPALMVKKEIIDQLSGYDERFFLFFEDTDLCRRIWQAGWQVWFVPESAMVHYPHRASGHDLGLWSLRKKATWHHIASWLKYFWKWISDGSRIGIPP